MDELEKNTKRGDRILKSDKVRKRRSKVKDVIFETTSRKYAKLRKARKNKNI